MEALLDELREAGANDYLRTLMRVEDLLPGATALERCYLGGVLVDLGSARQDRAVVERGRDLIAAYLDDPLANRAFTYMLGTAEGEATRCDPDRSPAWAERNRDQRRRARQLLREAADAPSTPTATAAMALINLGNEFYRTARVSEAFDAYDEALLRVPDHPVAAGWLAAVIWDLRARGGFVSDGLFHHGAYCARLAIARSDQVASIAGGTVNDRFAWLADAFAHEAGDMEPSPVEAYPPRSYHAFVRENRLALSFAFDAADPATWDNVNFVRLPRRLGGSSTDTYAYLNVLKEDYLLARTLVYEAFVDDRADSAEYVDTHDAARYGSEVAKFRLGLRAAYDILDRLAVAANELLSIGLTPDQVDFRKLWRDQRTKELRPAVRGLYAKEIWPVVGLVEIADDFARGGLLSPLGEWRNSSTHRFLRARLEGAAPPNPRAAVTEGTFDELSRSAIRALATARVAILSFTSALQHV